MEPPGDAPVTTQRKQRNKKRKYRIVGSSAPASPGCVPESAAQAEDPERKAVEWFGRSRRDLIAETAYHKAARRGFIGGDSDRDWYEAEAEVDARLKKGPPF